MSAESATRPPQAATRPPQADPPASPPTLELIGEGTSCSLDGTCD